MSIPLDQTPTYRHTAAGPGCSSLHPIWKIDESGSDATNNKGLSENRVYSQWNSHLIGIMIINQWVYGYTIFRHTHMMYGMFVALVDRFPYYIYSLWYLAYSPISSVVFQVPTNSSINHHVSVLFSIKMIVKQPNHTSCLTTILDG